MENMKIRLAGQDFEIDQLNLGQLRDLSIGVVLPDVTDTQESVRRSFDRAVGVIAAALRVRHPEMTVAAIYDMPVTREEMRKANDDVLEFSGLLPKKLAAVKGGAAPGEEAAEAA